MDSMDLNFLPPGKDALLAIDHSTENDLESLSKLDLLQLLKETKRHCVTIEDSNRDLQESVDKLEKALDEQYKKCQNLEEDKSFLRNNIKKASANWFERKKLSESENDQGNLEQDLNDENETKKQRKEGSHCLITEEAVELFLEMKYKDEQLELSNRCCTELNKRLKDYEKLIDDQEVIIHGLEKQLATYFNDNQLMSKQLADLNRLFADLEAINEKQVKVPTTTPEEVFEIDHLPTSEEFKEMSGSVAKTYIKLKELIYEKKSLVTEIERLQTLNVELQNRVSHQETRLISVSDALQTTWLLVSNLKDKHAKIHTGETILRYELREKREILHRLREELECSREQWHTIRQKNSETEHEWTILREELDERRKLRKLAEMDGNQQLTAEEVEGAIGGTSTPENEFEPPIDLLVDMGIEYGVIHADDEESTTVVALIDGQDVHEHRLHNLEEQCSFLYQKLMTSTSRALTLASRLSSLHEPYAMSDDDEDDEDDDDDDENQQYFDEDDEDDVNIYESEMVSPDSESNDTAYVSEADGADSGVTETIVNEGDSSLTEMPNAESPDMMDDCGNMSRRLINFLPRKIEILRAENKKLEERLQTQQDEKIKSESTLNTSIEFERRQRRQLEQQLSHLGKCVDELKLERNGKIAKVEEELRKKVEQVEKDEKEHEQLHDELQDLKEKYDQRGELLQLTATQLEETVKESEEKFSSLQQEIICLRNDFVQQKSNTTTSLQNNRSDQRTSNEEDHLDNTDSKCEQGAMSSWEKVFGTSSSLEYDKTTENTEATEHKITNLSHLLKLDGQLRKLTIVSDSCLRVSSYLPIGSILVWDFQVTDKEIRFGITYENLSYPATSLTSPDSKEESPIPPKSHSQFHCPPSFSSPPFSTPTPPSPTPSLNDPPTPSFPVSFTSQLALSKDLLLPHRVPSSCEPTTGRLFPKVSGVYSLVFQNYNPESQEVLLRLWIEEPTHEQGGN